MKNNSYFIDTYNTLEQDLLRVIGKYLGTNKDLGILEWRINKYQQKQLMEYEINQILKKHNIEKMPLIDEWFNDEVSEALKMIGKEIERVNGVSYIDIPRVNMRAESVKNHVEATLTFVDASMKNETIRKYNHQIEAITQAVEDGRPLDDVLVEAAIEIGREGTPALTDVLGRKWQPETYITMVEKANDKRLLSTVKDESMDQNDIDLVEVDFFNDSRPSHIPYQGRIYSRSGKSDKYPPLSITGYGEIDGIETGINCRHRTYPYVEGLSRRTFDRVSTQEEVEEIEENYRESQRQRYYEREIRKAKKGVVVAEAMGVDTTKAKQNVRNRQRLAREFIKESGRTRRYNREQI